MATSKKASKKKVANKKASKKKVASKKATKKSVAGKAPKKKASAAKAAQAKPAESRPRTAPASGARRSFSLTAKQAATLQDKLSDCPVAWGLEVRTGDEWIEATGKTALAEHRNWLFKLKDGLAGSDGGESSVEGLELGVTFDKRITGLPPLGALASLDISHLSAAGSLSLGGQVTDISSIGTLKGLKSLNLSICTKLEDISPLATVKSLKSLNLKKCTRLSNVSPLSSLKRLETLNLSGCDVLTDVSDLAGLKALQHLDLSNCVKLANISGLRKLKGLRSLDISGCGELTDVSELSRLKDLRVLKLSTLRDRPSKLEDISIVAKLKGLQHLELNYFKKRPDVSDLAGLKNLQRLFLSGCTALADISALSGLQKLQTLDLSGCPNLDDLLPLAELQSLEIVRLRQCTALTEVTHLSGLTNLRAVSLNACGNVRDLESLIGCESLRSLTWNEVPACNNVLAACAAGRQDAELVKEKHKEWIESFRDSKKPDRMAQRLVGCFGLGGKQEWAASALDSFIDPARKEHKGQIQGETWAKWAEQVLALGDPDLRGHIESALKEIDPEHEITALLGPVLTALASALPSLDADARDWARKQVEDALSPHAGQPEQGRKAAPAAVVFYMALDENDEDGNVKKWLDRGTVANVPSWRDKVRLALIEWQLDRGDEGNNSKLEKALRELRRIQTGKYQDLAHAALAQRFDVFDTPADALNNHLEAIKDDALRARVAKQMAEDPRVTDGAGSFSALLLALQDDREALAELIRRLLGGQGNALLAAAIRRAFDEEPRDQVAGRLADLDVDSLDGEAALLLLKELRTRVLQGTEV